MRDVRWVKVEAATLKYRPVEMCMSCATLKAGEPALEPLHLDMGLNLDRLKRDVRRSCSPVLGVARAKLKQTIP
jgi:hypothetical protein